MSPPVSDPVPPSYLAHRALLIATVVLTVWVVGLLAVPAVDTALDTIESAITGIRQQWTDLGWSLT